MADYECYSRTNYFKVTDEEKLREIAALVEAKLGMNETEDGNTFVLYSEGPITWYEDEENNEIIEIFEDIQDILPKGEMAVFQEIGREKLRFVNGVSVLVTPEKIEVFNMMNEIEKRAIEMGHTKKLHLTH